MLTFGARGFAKTAQMAALGAAGENLLFLVDYLLRFLRVALLLSLWRLILARHPTPEMGTAAVLTYTLIAEVFSEPLACQTELDVSLWNGTITTRVLRPVSLVAQFAAEAGGRWLFAFLFFSLPLLACAPLLGVDPLPANFRAALLFPLSLALSLVVGLALEFLFGAWMLMVEQNPWNVGRIRTALTVLLSGRLLPLPLLPYGLGAVFGWLPTSAQAAAPLQVYTSAGNPFRLLLLQGGWAVALSLAALHVWNRNRERLVSHGG